MRKKELLQMPKLRATPYMMRLAREDEPKLIRYTYPQIIRYKREAYARCCTKNGILKMAIFFPNTMRKGATLPDYEIYVDKENEQYLTYEREMNRWLTGSIRRIDIGFYRWDGSLWCARETNKTLGNYFSTDKKGIKAICEFQDEVLKKKLLQRHKKETDPWDEDLEQTRALPKDWEDWVSKVGIPKHFIFYQYSQKKKGQTGYCTHCKKEVPIKNPKYNKEGVCPKCRAKVIYKSTGKCGTVATDYYCAHLIQRCDDGVMLREFSVKRIHKSTDLKKPMVLISETRRIICDRQGYPQRAYYFGWYKHCEYRWIRTGVSCVNQGYSYFCTSYEGKVYGKTIPDLSANELKKTGFREYYQKKGVADPELFLVGMSKYPYLEKLVKVGLTRIFDEHIRAYWRDAESSFDKTQTSVLKMLRLNAPQLKRLRGCNGDMKLLYWLQYENQRGRQIADKTMAWLCDNKFTVKDFAFLRDKMSVEQIHHYVQRQMQENRMKLREVLTTWSDYLAMAKRVGLDTNDEIIYRVRKLKQRHDELVELCNSKDDAIRAGEILKKFPNIEKVLAEIKDKYEYSDENYIVIVPERIENIFLEARTLHHCVGEERYLERIATNETYIMFLRKTEAPDIPYYTIEVEPGGTIRQKRTMYDRQNEDIEEAKIFLQKWQQSIALHMTKKDHTLAKESKRLRLEEFGQMDKDNILINTGRLQGRRLVDVLMEDLMEAA